jgi:NAD(P)-dependent dehydrogenase (short-subunit alcohol dehydrogenase family)
LIKNSADGRVINVSSIAHKRGRLNFNDLFFENSYHAYKAYADSKLMLIYFTYELAEQLNGENVTVNTLHPGVISTKLLTAGFDMEGDDVTVGAETPVYLAVSEEVSHITGKYFDKLQIVSSSPLSYDLYAREQLMKVTRQVIKKFL